MSGEYFLYGLAGIILLYFALKILKWPIKILVNGIVGVVLLFIVNLLGSNLDMLGINYAFNLPINPITALIAGFFGIPGIIVIVLIMLF